MHFPFKPITHYNGNIVALVNEEFTLVQINTYIQRLMIISSFEIKHAISIWTSPVHILYVTQNEVLLLFCFPFLKYMKLIHSLSAAK